MHACHSESAQLYNISLTNEIVNGYISLQQCPHGVTPINPMALALNLQQCHESHKPHSGQIILLFSPSTDMQELLLSHSITEYENSNFHFHFQFN